MSKNAPLQHARDVTRSIRNELQSLLLDAPEHAKPIGRVLKRVSAIEEHLDEIAASRSGKKEHRPVPAAAVSHYDVEPSRSGLAIAEHRSTGAEPFRCPIPTFEATVAALDKLTTAKFEQLAEAVAGVLGEPPPAYQIRTAVRFLKCLNLVDHQRATFTVKTPKSFRKDAAAGLKHLHNKRLNTQRTTTASKSKAKGRG